MKSEPKKDNKVPRNFRFSKDVDEALRELAESLDTTDTDVIETAIRLFGDPIAQAIEKRRLTKKARRKTDNA